MAGIDGIETAGDDSGRGDVDCPQFDPGDSPDEGGYLSEAASIKNSRSGQIDWSRTFGVDDSPPYCQPSQRRKSSKHRSPFGRFTTS